MKCVSIFVEGDTEEEFYKKMLEALRENCANNRFNADKVTPINVKGISNYKTKVQRIFSKRIINKYPDMDHYVVLCYDTDVFELSQNPPVNWNDVKKMLKDEGAKVIIEVKAKKSIEDWFLKDMNGIVSYLGLSKNIKPKGGTGLQRLEYLFRKADKLYIKGTRSAGFVDSLNIKCILSQICDELKPLCKVLGIKCDGSKCHR